MTVNRDARGPERLATGYAGRISIALAAGAFALNLGRHVIPPLLPTIIGDLQITEARAGFALTVLWGVYALLQYPGGRFADEATRKTGLILGILILGVGFALLLVTRTYAVFLLSVALIGVGAAFYMLATRTLLSDLYRERRGQAFGLNIAAGQVGSIAAGGLAVAALALVTWQASFLPVIGVLVLAGIVLHRAGREEYRFSRIDLSVRETAVRVFGSPEIRRLVVAYSLVIFTWQGVIGFLPAYLQAVKGFSTALASGGFATVFAIGLLVQPAAGAISDRTARVPVAGTAALVAATGLGLLIVAPSPVWTAASIVVFATGLLGFSPVMQAYLMDTFPDDSMGGDLGAFKTVYEGLGSLGPGYVGVVVGLIGYRIAFSGLLGCLVLSVGLLAWDARSDP